MVWRPDDNVVLHPVELKGFVHERFEEQARRTPDSIAVICGETRLTYAELNAKANQLARHLRTALAVGPDKLVGICIERRLEMVLGLLGVLKAGGACVPLDPRYPAARLQYMLEDTGLRMVLSTQLQTPRIPKDMGIATIWIESGLYELQDGADIPAVVTGLAAQNLVYVIYTSGSSGSPKGTAMTHRSLANLIEWQRRSMGGGEDQRVLQLASLSFDVSFQEIFSTLCTGGTLVLVPAWAPGDVRAVAEILSEERIERLFVTPSMLQSLAEHVEASRVVPVHLKDVVAAGERLRITPEISRLFTRLENCRLHNHYGPTETHVVTALTLEGNPKAWPVAPPIGRPISGTQIHILDERMQPVPLGALGEICVGGVAVARGYDDRPGLTAERFLQDPFSSDPRARLYRTGDLGRWRADGNIEFLGRDDDQVKIRGFRVEPGEIEAQLATHPQVKETVVRAWEDVPGGKCLVAYLTLRDPGDAGVESLHTHLKGLLPTYMVPGAFVILERLPLSPNGKVDRQALPAPGPDTFVSREALPEEVREQLEKTWGEILEAAWPPFPPMGKPGAFNPWLRRVVRTIRSGAWRLDGPTDDVVPE